MANPRDVDRGINYFFSSTDVLMKGISTSAILMNCFLDYVNKDKESEAIKKYVKKGGNLELFSTKQKLADKVEKELKAAGVRFVRQNGLTAGGEVLFVYAAADRKEVDQVRGQFAKDLNLGGLTSKDALHYISGGNILRIGNLSLQDAMIMIETAKKHNIVVAVEQTDKDRYRLLYDADDKKVMDNIKLTLAFQKANPVVYEAICKQIVYEDSKSLEIQRDVLSCDTEQTKYYADLEGNRMIVTKDEVQFFNIEGDSTTVFEHDYLRYNKIVSLIGGMNNPRELSEKEFLRYEAVPYNEKIEIIKAADKDRPEYTQEELMEIKKYEDARTLYEMKLAQDNPEQVIYQYSYYNNEMRMPAFSEMEKINEDAIHDRREAQEAVTPEYYDEARGLYYGYREDEPELSYESEKFADSILDEEIIDIASDYEEREKMMDLSYDMNANFIPDDLEPDFDY